MPQRNVNCKVELLIGSDIPEALEPHEVRRSKCGGPFAIKTKFGWTLNGPPGRPGIGSNNCFFTHPKHCEDDARSLLIQYCHREFDEPINTTEKTMSVNDKKALKIVEDSVVLKKDITRCPFHGKTVMKLGFHRMHC